MFQCLGGSGVGGEFVGTPRSKQRTATPATRMTAIASQVVRETAASVMPAVPSGNCHTGILMIAERAADLVKTANGLQMQGPAAATRTSAGALAAAAR